MTPALIVGLDVLLGLAFPRLMVPIEPIVRRAVRAGMAIFVCCRPPESLRKTPTATPEPPGTALPYLRHPV